MATLALSFAFVHVSSYIYPSRAYSHRSIERKRDTESHNKFAGCAQKKDRLRKGSMSRFPPEEIVGFIDVPSSSPYSQEYFRRSRFTNRHEIGQTRTYISISVPRNLLFTNSLFEEYHGVTSAYHFMTTWVRSRATRISAAMGVVDIGLTAIDRKYIRDVELCREEREQCRLVVSVLFRCNRFSTINFFFCYALDCLIKIVSLKFSIFYISRNK